MLSFLGALNKVLDSYFVSMRIKEDIKNEVSTFNRNFICYPYWFQVVNTDVNGVR